MYVDIYYMPIWFLMNSLVKKDNQQNNKNTSIHYLQAVFDIMHVSNTSLLLHQAEQLLKL